MSDLLPLLLAAGSSELLLVIALIGLAGIGAQWIAWRTGWPAIALLLVAGIILGPVTGLLHPEETFGQLYEPMINVAVAIILFEGGLSLRFSELKKTGGAVPRLVFIGVPVAWGLGALALYEVAGLVWPVAILFAGILVVTGPTVIIPLLRQTNLKQRPRAILKWEGIVNDPIGALLAVFTYEWLVQAQRGTSPIDNMIGIVVSSAFAAGIGYGAAYAVRYLFPRGLVPEFLKAPVLLVFVLGTFTISNLIQNETGLVAVTVMGIALGNMNVSSLRSVHPFKENIAIILVSGIFILLASSLQAEDLQYFNWRFGAFLFVLLFFVRPATVLISMLGSNVPWNERLFVAWIAPRGIVLVAICGLFALRLSELGYADGNVLIGLSFAVVVATIIAHGFSVNFVARLLKIKGESRPGLMIVGSTPWTIALAKEMRALKTPTMVVDSSWQRLSAARREGIPYYNGEILNEATEHNLDLTPYQVLVAATENEAYNALVCNEFAHEIGRDSVYQLGESADDDHRALPVSLRGRALFESGFGVTDVQELKQQGWVFRKTRLTSEYSYEDALEDLPEDAHLLMLLRDSGRMRFFTHAARPEPRAGDTVISFVPPQVRKPEKADSRSGTPGGPSVQPA